MKKEIIKTEHARFLFAGLVLGLFAGGYVLNWTPVGQKAYLMTRGQLFIWVAVLFISGAAMTTITQYPVLKFKKFLLGKGAEIVAIEYISKSGQIRHNIIKYAPQVKISGMRYALVRPAFYFLGLPAYRIYEGCALSLDFDPEGIERQMNDMAVDIENETVYERDGQQYTLVPRGDTLAALSAANLQNAYSYATDLGLAQAQTRAEKKINGIFVLCLVTFIAAAVAAYYSYYGTDAIMKGLNTTVKNVADAVALLKASGGIQQ